MEGSFLLFGCSLRSTERKNPFVMTSPLLFLTRLQLSSVASKISLNLLPTGGLLRCVSKGLAPRLMWSHLQPVLLWTQASRPADMFIHSLKLERKEKTTPSTPRFWLQIIQALLWAEQKPLNLNLWGLDSAWFVHYFDWEIPYLIM